MQLKKVFFLIIFLSLISPMSNHAQQKEMRFEHLSIDDGLSQNTINCITQDTQGFMWFGTQDGLNRFDGYQFKVYKYDPADTTSLTKSSWAVTFVNDPFGHLWIGTINGLCRYNEEHDNFFRVPFQNELIRHKRLNALMLDRTGKLWIASRQGLSKVTLNENGLGEMEHFDPASIGENLTYATALLEDKNGNVWVGTKNGLIKFPHGNLKSNDLQVFTTASIGGILSHAYIKALVESNNGDIWVGTQNGLNILTPDGQLLNQYYHNPRQVTSLSENWVESLFKDSKGNIWVGSYSEGVCLFNQESNDFVRIKNELGNPYSLNDNNIIRTIYEDKHGIIWIGTSLGGINYYDETKMKFRHFRESKEKGKGLNDHIMRSFFLDDENVLWVGTQNGGINLYDFKTDSYSYLKHKPSDKNSISGNHIRSMTKDLSGNIWVATRRNGLNRLTNKGAKLTVTRFEHDPKNENSLSANALTTVSVDRDGFIWVLDYYGVIQRYNPIDDTFEKVFDRGNSDRTIYIDRKENILWVASENWVKTYNISTKTIDRTFKGIPAALLKSIYKRTDQNVWIGSSVGLIQLDIKTGDFRLLTTKDGLANNMVYSALEGSTGAVWMSTNKGVSKYIPENGKFKNYDVTDGLQSNEFNTGAYHIATNGMLIFGGINGFNAFMPSEIKDNSYSPEIVFTDFQLFSKPVPIYHQKQFPNSPLKKNITLTKSLSLSYQDYVILLEFSTLHYADPSKNKYAYQLEPFDADWNFTNANRRAITYTNLAPGDYVFKVRASNNDGVWNDEGITMQIAISPPWYKILWVQLFMAFLALAGIYAIYRIRMNVLQHQKKVLEQTVMERTHEVTEQNKKLEIQQEEIIVQRDNLEHSYQNVKIMSDIGQEITSLLNQRDLIKQLYQHVNELMDATGFGVGLIRNGQLEFVNFMEKNKPLPDFSVSMTEDQKFAVWCAKNKKSVFINDIFKDYIHYVIEEPKSLEGELPESLIYVPLLVGQKAIGVTTVQSFTKNAYTSYHKSLLQNLATFIAIALNNANTYHQLDEVKQEIEIKNMQMLDSIRYAETIQNAILPPVEEVKKIFEESFVFFKPKDIVSGDFYWCVEKDGKKYIAVVDCTGHGVPGAFMSIIGHSLLNEILNKHGAITPAQILKQLDIEVKIVLRQQEERNADGMDVSLCCIDITSQELVFAGAKRPLWYGANGEMNYLKGDRISIGGFHKKSEVKFTNQSIELKKGTMYYLFSDGYADQSNDNGKKIGSKQFREYLTLLVDKPVDEQQELIASYLKNHQGNAAQRDDIAILGFRV